MSQKCRQFDEALISGYLDGALSLTDRQQARWHLRRCVSCRRLLEDFQELRNNMMSTRWRAPAEFLACPRQNRVDGYEAFQKHSYDL